jgi:hypothetical protein
MGTTASLVQVRYEPQAMSLGYESVVRKEPVSGRKEHKPADSLLRSGACIGRAMLISDSGGCRPLI